MCADAQITQDKCRVIFIISNYSVKNPKWDYPKDPFGKARVCILTFEGGYSDINEGFSNIRKFDPDDLPGGDNKFIGGVADKNEVIEQLLVPFLNTDLSAYGGFAQIK